MKKWEYYRRARWRQAEHPMLLLNEMGQDGWELVSVVGNDAYFKRPLEPRYAGDALDHAVEILSEGKRCFLLAMMDWSEEDFDENGDEIKDGVSLRQSHYFSNDDYEISQVEIDVGGDWPVSCWKMVEKEPV